MNKITVKEEHIKLLSKAYIKWEYGAEFVLQIILRHTDKSPKSLIGKTFVCKNYYNWEEE